MAASVTRSGAQPSPSRTPGATSLTRTPAQASTETEQAGEPERVADDARHASGARGDEVRVRRGQTQAADLDEQERQAVGDREEALARVVPSSRATTTDDGQPEHKSHPPCPRTSGRRRCAAEPVRSPAVGSASRSACDEIRAVRRLLLVSHRPIDQAGGPAARWRSFSRHLPEHGWEVDVVSAGGGDEFASPEQRAGAGEGHGDGRQGRRPCLPARRAATRGDAAVDALGAARSPGDPSAGCAAGGYDAVLATGPPFAALIAARRAAGDVPARRRAARPLGRQPGLRPWRPRAAAGSSRGSS